MSTLIAELASNHGGDLDLAKQMIDDAVAGGATMVKTQAYRVESLNQNDPQYAWLRQAALSEENHVALKAHADALGVPYFASVFDQPSAEFIAKLCGRLKFASTERVRAVEAFGVSVFKSFRWGLGYLSSMPLVPLAAVPLYPTPLEALARVEHWGQMGWSDHCVGLSGCQYAIAHGADLVEVHVSIPGKGRQCVWDKSQDDLKRLRDWLADVETIRTGVSRTFRERWGS